MNSKKKSLLAIAILFSDFYRRRKMKNGMIWKKNYSKDAESEADRLLSLLGNWCYVNTDTSVSNPIRSPFVRDGVYDKEMADQVDMMKLVCFNVLNYSTEKQSNIEVNTSENIIVPMKKLKRTW